MNDIKNKWDERYAQKEYVYGKEPNEFFKQELAKHKPGKILLPAEGEGRNAVYAAKLGWEVYAFDSSSEAIKKAQQLASENNVEIHYTLSSFEEADYPDDFFDLIGLFYAHTLSRADNHKKLIRFLKPKGTIILEGFSKEQIHYNSGGPSKIEMLFSEEELQSDFADLTELITEKMEIQLNEGKQHNGKASVIRLIGLK
ncbi:class I SAM-dependent methyltransferase [Tenuifilum osseticum]|uniref:class I SAM-dependent methyltransferase n=1 Tax=Tenuifilum osseticum TaxID=3374723 RepID=UPI0034E613CA